MAPRQMIPKNALDYPKIDPEIYVCWWSNDTPWPSGARQLSYISWTKKNPRDGWALWTQSITEAKLFSDAQSARAWVDLQEHVRGVPYGGVRITTVEELISICFPTKQA